MFSQSIILPLIIVLALTASMCAFAAPAQSGRDRLLMDFGWKFKFGRLLDVDGGAFVKAGASGEYGVRAVDSDWRTVDLPHDWVVELPFVASGDLSHGCRPVGKAFPETSIGWYARRFDVPKEDLGRRVSIEFDGVFRNCQVWFNGYYLGRNESGYSPFAFDITDYLNYGGSNRLVLRVDATQFEGWFYEGAGIYRHVWLVKTSQVHVPQWGTFVTSEVKGDSARVTACVKVETTGEPAAVKLIPDRVEIDADGEDISIITVEIVDSKGRVVPTAGNEVTFDLTGGGRIIGVGNGAPASHEPDKFLDLPEFRTVDNWRMKMIDSTENRPETAENYDDSGWEKVDAQDPQMPLANTMAVFRTQFDLSESDLRRPSISLHFGSIDDIGWICINGKPAGQTNDWSRSWTIDIGKLVKPGWNTVAVVVRNQGNTGGLVSGTRLEIARAAGSWKRNAFNGLAQIIVQSTKSAGEISLRAQSEGLEPDAVALKSKECQPRPAVP